MKKPKKQHIVLFNPDQWRGDVMGHKGDASAATPHVETVCLMSRKEK